jgi:hypothetical protein
MRATQNLKHRVGAALLTASLVADSWRRDADAYQGIPQDTIPETTAKQGVPRGEIGPIAPPARAGTQRSPFEGVKLPPIHPAEGMSPEQKIASPSAEHERSWLFGPIPTLFSAAAATVAMAWYYLQVRSRKTPTSIASSAIYATNDAVLFGTALLTTAQGWPTRAVYGIVTICSLAILHGTWVNDRDDQSRQSEKRSLLPDFSTSERVCMGFSIGGLGAMLLSTSSVAAEALDPSTLLLISSALGSTVYTLASLLLLMTTWAEEKTQAALPEPPSDSKERLRKSLAPALPWMLSTAAMLVGTLSVEEYSLATLLSPAVLCTNNAIISGSLFVWAWRKSEPKEPHQKAS